MRPEGKVHLDVSNLIPTGRRVRPLSNPPSVLSIMFYVHWTSDVPWSAATN
jgi:hypothetical protein